MNRKYVKSGGFHQAWLIPLEGLFAFVMLAVARNFGFGVAILTIMLPSLLLAYKASQNREITSLVNNILRFASVKHHKITALPKKIGKASNKPLLRSI